MVNEVVPVFVTVTTDCVRLLFSRLFPKLKELPLKVAFVEAAGATGLTVKAVVTLWLSDPDVAWSEMVALPATAAGLALTLICWRPPGAMDRVMGVAVTPLGKEPTATLTFPEKPFMGEAASVTVCAAPPGAIVIEDGTIARLKSPEAVAGLLEVPPLHPVKIVNTETAHRKGKRDCMVWLQKIRVRVFSFQVMQEGRYGPCDHSIPYCSS